ncbi:MAG: tetratricopeptide repeat protein [Nitrospirota bacterium]
MAKIKKDGEGQLQKLQALWKNVAEVKPAVVLVIATTNNGGSSGTGFIISKDGYILTNEHVIHSANKVKVYVNNENEYEAIVIKIDEDYDLAILKINAFNLITANLGDSDELHEGDEIAITGYPEPDKFIDAGFSICASTSKGNVSAIRQGKTDITKSPTVFIQTDAAINPGNSGGPLYLAETGEVMGIANAKIIGAEGIGLAIPINVAKNLLKREGIDIKGNPSQPIPFAKPEPKEPSTTLTAFDYLLRGNEYYNKGLYDQAILDYNKALEINPRCAEAYNNRGIAYKNKGLYDQAISDYNKAIEINPRYAEAYYNRGSAYYNKGLYDQAISDYNKALEINPRDAEAYNNRGIAYKNKGLYDQAISDYNKAIEINPRYANAYYNKALVCKKAGRKEEAIEAYKGFLQYAPQQDPNIERAREGIRELEKKWW